MRGEVTRREAAAKGLGVTDTPPLTSLAVDGASEDAGCAVPRRADVPIPDHALRGLPSLLKLMGPRTKEPVAEPVMPFSSLRLLGRSPLSESGPPNLMLPLSELATGSKLTVRSSGDVQSHTHLLGERGAWCPGERQRGDRGAGEEERAKPA